MHQNTRRHPVFLVFRVRRFVDFLALHALWVYLWHTVRYESDWGQLNEQQTATYVRPEK